MNKRTKELIDKKINNLKDLKFFNRTNHQWSNEQKVIQDGSYPKCNTDYLSDYPKEWHWLHMEYMIATPTDVRDQCHACGIRPQLTSHLKEIIVGDLIIRNGKGSKFNSYHVPCAMKLIKEMSDKLLQTLQRNETLTPILQDQEMLKNGVGMY